MGSGWSSRTTAALEKKLNVEISSKVSVKKVQDAVRKLPRLIPRPNLVNIIRPKPLPIIVPSQKRALPLPVPDLGPEFGIPMPKPGSSSSSGSGSSGKGSEPLVPGQNALEAGNAGSGGSVGSGDSGNNSGSSVRSRKRASGSSSGDGQGGSGGSGHDSEFRKPTLAPRRKLARTGSAKDLGFESEPLEPKEKGSDSEAVSPAKRVRKGGPPAPVPVPDDLIAENHEWIVALKDWRDEKVNLLYYLKESGIHGKGLFALQPIPSGTIIIEYTGDVIGLVEADDREREYLSRKDPITNIYFMCLKKDKVIDATFEGNVSKYINHSCSPNSVAEVMDTIIDGVRASVAVITAVKEIPRDAELTYDYGFAYERNPGRRVACQCGAPNCRKVINKVEPPNNSI